MTRGEFEIFLLGTSIVCLLMALISSLRYRSRGPAAFALGGAFAALAATLFLIRGDSDRNIVIGGFVAVVLFLMADVALRAGRAGGSDPPK